MTEKIIESEITTKMLETDIKIASNGTINAFQYDINWMHLYLTYLEEDYGAKVDPAERIGISPEEALEEEKWRIDYARGVLAEVKAGEIKDPATALAKAHTLLIDGKQKLAYISYEIVKLYYALAEEFNIDLRTQS